MELSRKQQNFIKTKPQLFNVLKGKKGTGKTTAAVYRAVYLKNNYSMFDDDSILFIAQNNETIEKLNTKINSALAEKEDEYYSFFSRSNCSIKTTRFDQLIDNYFEKYKKKNNVNLNVIKDLHTKRELILECIDYLKDEYRRSKILKEEYTEFFINEISWIKENKITILSQYQNIIRKGCNLKNIKGPKSIRRNSITRKVIYSLMKLYDDKLLENNFIEENEKITLAMSEMMLNEKKYSHIIIDESEYLIKSHIDFIKALNNPKSYSSITFIIDVDNEVNNSYLLKNKRVYIKKLNEKVKTYNFKQTMSYDINEYKSLKSVQNNKELMESSGIEVYEYVDLRHDKTFDLMRDYSSVQDIVVKDGEDEIEYKNDELIEIPVFNNIAAGEPIYIESEQQDNFYIPKYWLKGMKNCFILKVKGDSMINANINDGDFILIRQQQDARHNDIVAVNLNGNATLKRLHIGKEDVLLMPENKLYDPIPINDEGVMLLGKAVGIIKSKF